MRDWFPSFNWPDVIALAVMLATLNVLALWGDAGLVIRDSALPMALVVGYVVFWRWRRR